MSVQKQSDSREVILETACRLFAEKGYEKTTIRDLCKEAETYQVSINYYFGSKENLFKEACLQAFNFTDEARLPDKIKRLNVEEQLKAVIRSLLEMVYSDEKKGWFFKILSRDEDILLKKSINTVLREKQEFHFSLFQSILRELFEDKISESNIRYAYFVLISHIFTLNHNFARFKEHFFSGEKPDKKELESLTAKIYRLIIAGIKDLNK
ncbi:MAG: helix-turn-helix domain-containing protein [Cyanobacteriota bacterium]